MSVKNFVVFLLILFHECNYVLSSYIPLTLKYPACIDDSDCVGLGHTYACFLYKCYPWKKPTDEHPTCRTDLDCWDGQGRCFWHHSVRRVNQGICFRSVETCQNHEHCSNHHAGDKCCYRHCCPEEYYEAWRQYRCYSDVGCQDLMTGNKCCPNGLCCFEDTDKTEIYQIGMSGTNHSISTTVLSAESSLQNTTQFVESAQEEEATELTQDDTEQTSVISQLPVTEMSIEESSSLEVIETTSTTLEQQEIITDETTNLLIDVTNDSESDVQISSSDQISTIVTESESEPDSIDLGTTITSLLVSQPPDVEVQSEEVLENLTTSTNYSDTAIDTQSDNDTIMASSVSTFIEIDPEISPSEDTDNVTSSETPMNLTEINIDNFNSSEPKMTDSEIASVFAENETLSVVEEEESNITEITSQTNIVEEEESNIPEITSQTNDSLYKTLQMLDESETTTTSNEEESYYVLLNSDPTPESTYSTGEDSQQLITEESQTESENENDDEDNTPLVFEATISETFPTETDNSYVLAATEGSEVYSTAENPIQSTTFQRLQSTPNDRAQPRANNHHVGGMSGCMCSTTTKNSAGRHEAMLSSFIIAVSTIVFNKY